MFNTSNTFIHIWDMKHVILIFTDLSRTYRLWCSTPYWMYLEWIFRFILRLSSTVSVNSLIEITAFNVLLHMVTHTMTLWSNTKNLLQIPHTKLKRFVDRAFGMSSLITSKLLTVRQSSRNSWKKCYFKMSLFDFMDYKHLSNDYSLKCLWTL